MSSGTPRVDVVIVSWNVREELLGCVGSVLASTGVAVRVVVVDNASTDASAEVLAERFPGITLLRNPRNRGFAAAANQGIGAADAPWVLLLNPDTVVPPDAIVRLVDRLGGLPGHLAVAPRLVDVEGRPEHSVHRLPSLGLSLLLGTGAHRLLSRAVRSSLLLEGSWASDVERDVPWAVGACLLLRRSGVVSLGGLDERFFMYAEDMELCERAGRAGWRVRFVPTVTVVHARDRSGRQRYGDDRTAAWLRSTVAFLRRRHGATWTAAWLLLNGAATTTRYASGRCLMRFHPTPHRAALQSLWRSHVRYYLGRAVIPEDAAST